jgi:glycosyltransferase involved in cell wall biosynthesis
MVKIPVTSTNYNMPRTKKKKLSIVIPVLNEEKNIKILNKRIEKTLRGNLNYEVIWVDDGSKDKTEEILKEICKEKDVKGISLMTRTGQSGALMAGIEMAKGDYIATMDGDNQDDPKDFIKMIKKLEKEDLDAVIGWRKNRWTGNFFRKLPSLTANKIMKIAFGDLGIHDTGCMMKVVRADVMKKIKLYGELHRFMSYLLGVYGAKIAEISVSHKPRKYGQSNYGLKRTITVLFDILNVKFLTMKRITPIQLMGPLAVLTYMVSFLSGGYLLYGKFANNINITGSPLFTTSLISFMMGTQFLLFGLLGELILRSYFENGTDKSVYAIRKRY